jgi:hypothetical protein
MASQQYATPPSRNPVTAAEGFGSGAKPGIVSSPEGKATLGKAPAPGVVGHKPGSSVKGFDGTLISGMVKA